MSDTRPDMTTPPIGADVERRARQGVLVLGALAIVLIGATHWLSPAAPLFITLIAGASFLVLTGLGRLGWSANRRGLTALVGALLLLAPAVVTAGQAVAELYDHRSHGGDMDLTTAGSWYASAAVGVMLGLAALVGVDHFSRALIDQVRLSLRRWGDNG